MGDKNLYVLGGEKLGKEFLGTLALPEGMRAVLYRNLDPNFSAVDLIDATGPFEQAERLAPLVERERQHPVEQMMRINWSADPASAEVFHVLPLKGRNGELLGVLLVGSSPARARRRGAANHSAVGRRHRSRHTAWSAFELVGRDASHPAGDKAGRGRETDCGGKSEYLGCRHIKG